MFKNVKTDFKSFMEVIDRCEGAVTVVTNEGDRINMKSKLCQLVGIASLIENGTIELDNLYCEKQEDASRIFRYLVYGEVERK